MLMAAYTFVCPNCKESITVTRMMQDGPPKDLEHCGQPMVRKYRPIRTIAFSPFEVQTDWMIENYNRYRARKKGKQAPRFSPDTINRPVKPIPGQAYYTRTSNVQRRKKNHV